MFTFYTNENIGKSISTCSLIKHINNIDSFYEDISINNISPEDYYIDLLVAIINNRDVCIYDDKAKIIIVLDKLQNKILLKNIDDLLEKVTQSTSKISLFTSGTTGKPKKIDHSVTRFVEMCRVDEKHVDDVWTMVYNPTHMAGIQVFFQALLNKNRIVYLFESKRDVLLEALRKEEVTHLSATPTFYRLLSPYDFYLPKILRCTLGGERSDVKLLESLKSVFVNAKINNIYASTEAGSVFISEGDTFKVIDKIIDKVKFIDNEIVLHQSLLGSFDKEEWFYTGDIVEFLEDERFIIVSRKSDFVNVGGNRVNLNEVEQIIRDVEEVVNVSISTQENSVLGKVLIANVVLNKELTKKEFKFLIKPFLKNYMMPTKINIVDSLETTKSGKLTRL